jgi:hypothetical protein
MEHTHYFVDCGHTLQSKNKLQAEFSNYLLSLKGRLIDANNLLSLQNEIGAKKDELNAKHPRCSPLSISFWKPSGTKHIVLSGFYCLTFSIKDAYYGSN